MTSPNKGVLRLETVKHPTNVKVLILAESKTTLKEFYLIRTYVNLIKVDLSHNKLTSFPQGFTFRTFQHLKTLFLHYNKFSALANLTPVSENKFIVYLTLFGNPLEEAKARHLFINELPSLMLMDDKIVKIQERCSHLQLEQKEAQVLPFPLLPSDKDAAEDNTEKHLEAVIRQLTIVRKYYLKVNPILQIQRWWKHLLRLRHTKWTITHLPVRQRVELVLSNLERSRTELERLVTQKMDIFKSKEELVWSALRQNWEFWTSFKDIVSTGHVYLSREYCRLNAIDFEQIKEYKIMNNFSDVPLAQLKNKKHLLFFLSYHNRIRIVKRIMPQGKWRGMQKLKLRSLAKKLQINPQKSLITDAKLQVLEEKYSFYVRPLLPFEQLLAMAKKQYVVFQKGLVKGYAPESYPFLFEPLLARTKAAIVIQKQWRGHKVRKQMDARLRIRQEEAAISIQRWIRNLKFQHRYKFLVEVGRYLQKQKSSSEIVLQMEQIPAIQQYCRLKQGTGINFLVCFQSHPFALTRSASVSYYNSHNRAKIVYFAERRPDPSYLNLSFRTETSKMAEEELNGDKTYNVLNILFKYAKNIEQVVDRKNTKHVKFTYDSVEETLNRKFILALKTYRMVNHQFITSKTQGNAPTATSLIDQLNQNKLVTILLDNERTAKLGSPEQAAKAIHTQRSVATLNSDYNMVDDAITIKIRFFLGTVDYSGLAILKSPGYNVGKTIRKEASLNSFRDGYYLGRKKSLSKRYEELQTEPVSKISRHVISLNKLEESGVASRKSSQLMKMLNTDQSHSYLQSLAENLHPKMEKFNRYDKFDKEVYPPVTEILKASLHYKQQQRQREDLKHKRSLIEDVKTSHNDKKSQVLEKRTQQLNILKQLKLKEQMEHEEKMKKLREEMERDRHRKHEKVKKHFKNTADSFEKDFLKKGNNSMRKDLRDFEKSRSERQYHLEDSFIHKSMESKSIHKTQIKEFSINITEREPTVKTRKVTEHQQDQTREKEGNQPVKDKRKYLLSGGSKDNNSLSIQSQEPPAKYLKSQEGLEAGLCREKKQLRKKKLVHSVFPEEFYPLKKSDGMGFQLPKITKK